MSGAVKKSLYQIRGKFMEWKLRDCITLTMGEFSDNVLYAILLDLVDAIFGAQTGHLIAKQRSVFQLSNFMPVCCGDGRPLSLRVFHLLFT